MNCSAAKPDFSIRQVMVYLDIAYLIVWLMCLFFRDR